MDTDYSRYLTQAVSLARYAEIITYTPCAFWGVARDSEANFACRDIWSKFQRDDVDFHLRGAQRQIENILGYPTIPTWISNEKTPYRNPVIAKKAHIIEVGIEAEETLAADVTVDHTTDPATVSFATTLTETDGIRVLYPEDLNEEIFPSKMTIASGTLTIYIPRCRMVAFDKRENPEEGLIYTDLTNFQEEVTVKRFYTDSTVQATLVWPHGCSQTCSSNGCEEHSETACEVITDHDAGIMELNPAEYVSGAWKNLTKICCGGKPEYTKLNYRAGTSTLSDLMEMAIVRLAHANMPSEPCGCDVVHNLWKRDSHVPQILTRDRIENPFGLSDGAWMAWQYASSEAIVKMGVFAGDRRRI